MSDKPDDGGPAFPAQHFDLAEGEHGLSLRDYFAAKALPAYFSDGAGWNQHDQAAKWAYEMADAMLKARQS
jgi:hypothetical protein